MKPADHPEFFLRPPPPGRSRESTLRLDREGRFWHDGRLVEHPGMARSFAAWMDRHPVDGRFILNNGYDWTYLEVEDAPCHVRTLHGRPASAPAPSAPAPSGDGHPEEPWLELADGSQEPLDPSTIWEGAGGALYCLVRGRRFRARFSQAAQLALEPYLVETSEGEVAVAIGARVHPVGRVPLEAGGSPPKRPAPERGA